MTSKAAKLMTDTTQNATTASDLNSHFGLCPMCKRTDGFLNAGRGHWFVCHEHRVRWFVGSNLCSAWRDETEDQQRHAYDVEPGWGAYRDVDPWRAWQEGMTAYQLERYNAVNGGWPNPVCYLPQTQPDDGLPF